METEIKWADGQAVIAESDIRWADGQPFVYYYEDAGGDLPDGVFLRRLLGVGMLTRKGNPWCRRTCA